MVFVVFSAVAFQTSIKINNIIGFVFLIIAVSLYLNSLLKKKITNYSDCAAW
jgi:uncharacterized protein (DUF486 family)